MNVVPNHAEAGFDIRIAPQVDIEQFRKKVRVEAALFAVLVNLCAVVERHLL